MVMKLLIPLYSMFPWLQSKTFNLTAEETLTFDEEFLPTPGALHKTPIVKDIQSLRMEQALNK